MSKTNPYFIPIVQPINMLQNDDRNDPITTLVPKIVQPVYTSPVNEQLKQIKKNNNGKLYFPAPPIILSHHKYQNVNADTNLQKMVTSNFYNCMKNIWLKEDSFKSLNKIFKQLKKKNTGYQIIYKLLRLYVKKYNQNWYDLELQTYNVKKFVLYKLQELIN
mgnify:CR=1 FL=1